VKIPKEAVAIIRRKLGSATNQRGRAREEGGKRRRWAKRTPRESKPHGGGGGGGGGVGGGGGGGGSKGKEGKRGFSSRRAKVIF